MCPSRPHLRLLRGGLSTAMAAQLCRDLTVSTPTPAPMTGTTAAKPTLWMPLNPRLDRPLRPPSRGFLAPTPLAFGSAGGNVMAAAVAHAGFLFAPARGNLINILIKWRPPPGNTRRGAVNDVCARNLRRYLQKKPGPEGPNKVGSVGERGLRARELPGSRQTSSLFSPQVWVWLAPPYLLREFGYLHYY